MKNTSTINTKLEDKFGHNLEYYRNLFPVGEPFIYRSKYGSETILITESVFTTHLLHGEIAFKIKVESTNDPYNYNHYEIDYCDRTKFIREAKLKRILKRN